MPLVDWHVHATALGPTDGPTFNEDGTHYHASATGPTGPNEPLEHGDHRHKMSEYTPGGGYTSGEFLHSQR